ncbi:MULTISPECIES: PHP domain-containing protein [Anaerotruncus]|jgi:predicted metal-dependent phosphoesterase TrpH|uniref:PHP domain-containing protein n=2 Tax=Oscillospiraceae TaxID=216572 RepID=UPI000832BF25|nr:MULTISPECIES: PHP domain-containing protein [Anaerotruncus]RGX56005.1 PHP domain-containing protein [Anaerotruncus sp. AF02-27]
MIGDLHCHSRFSDGSMGIDDLIFYAKRAGLDFIALTDHDTLSGNNRAEQLGKRFGIGVIPGVEISAFDRSRGRKVHLLCYQPKTPDRLEGLLKRTLENRDKCVRESMRKVMQLFPVTEEHILRNAKGSASLYYAHIMNALIDLGYTNEIYGKLFKELLGPQGSCYVRHEYPDVWEAAKLIRSAGGICVVAHPSSYRSIELAGELAREGLCDGLERFHPNNRPEDDAALDALIETYHLIPTGGTDFHGGFTSRPNPIGTCLTEKNSLERIFKLSKSR